jgi:hypothetical protein
LPAESDCQHELHDITNDPSRGHCALVGAEDICILFWAILNDKNRKKAHLIGRRRRRFIVEELQANFYGLGIREAFPSEV